MSNVKTFPDSFKVGIAFDHNARIRAYQTYDPHRAYKCEYHARTHLFRELEKHIHTVFKTHGEWLINIPLADIKREMARFLAGK